MGVCLPPLEFTECLGDSPTFRENLHKHEKELQNTSQQIKRLIKEVKDLLGAAQQLSSCQRSFARSLHGFTFECVGGTKTDDERVICSSLAEFGNLINNIEDERDRMLENAYAQVVVPLEEFRKNHIGAVKSGKKTFDKQTAKFYQRQEKNLSLSTKKQNDIKEADAFVDMAERYFYKASMDYVYLIQEVHERKKFEFVETLLGFMTSWITFYHQGYEVAKDFTPYKEGLQLRIQKTRDNFRDYSDKLKKKMDEIQKQQDPIRNTKGRKAGYLYLLEKKAFGQTWTKHYCTYDKNTKEFTMIPYNQLTTKSISPPEIMILSSCTRRMSDSIDKRFCFDLQVERPSNLYTFQALNDSDRNSWMDIMDGKEPTYTQSNANIKIQNSEERILDDVGIQFVRKCIEVLESRGLEEQGIYRVVGVTSKVTKLLNMGLDRRKVDKLANLEDAQEWETKTITSALKNYLRNLPEPLMTHGFHNDFIRAVKNDSRPARTNEVHSLIYQIPKDNFEVLKILIKHLTNVAARSDKNLMTVSNLGVCFGPTLLRPEEETVASIIDLKFYNIVVEILIENYQKIFNTEPEPLYMTGKSSPHVTSPYSNSMIEPSPFRSMYMYSEPDSLKYNDHPASMRSSVNQPFTCTVRAYFDPNPGTNLHNGSSNTLYSMSKSEHISSNGTPMGMHNKMMQRFSNSSSQSESNIPNLQTGGSPNFRSYGRLENSRSSSNESVLLGSREGSYPSTHHLAPKKSTRSIGVNYPKGYRSQGAVRVRTLYSCMGENDGELSFEPNQIITNVKASQEPGWLEGTLNGKTGLIPENYVEILP